VTQLSADVPSRVFDEAVAPKERVKDQSVEIADWYFGKRAA
jgi:hypothetical protein